MTTNKISELEARLVASEKKRRMQTLFLVLIPALCAVALVWYSQSSVQNSATETKVAKTELQTKTQEVQELQGFKTTVEEAVSTLPPAILPNPEIVESLTPKEKASYILNGFTHTVDSLKQENQTLKTEQKRILQEQATRQKRIEQAEINLQNARAEVAERDRRLQTADQDNATLRNNLERTRTELTTIRKTIEAQQLPPNLKSQLLNRVNTAIQNVQLTRN